ncbi:Transposase (plasmid) [Roseomonas mucosa]|nr:Transposase [Roseomonas mucosa]
MTTRRKPSSTGPAVLPWSRRPVRCGTYLQCPRCARHRCLRLIKPGKGKARPQPNLRNNAPIASRVEARDGTTRGERALRGARRHDRQLPATRLHDRGKPL